ncbi:MAG: metal-dependent hydrolase [Dichotomicrobium sp.]
MANFSTHLGVGAVASGLAASVTLAAGAVPPGELATLTAAGIVGSILPDIDLDRSHPSRMLFGALGILFAFIALFQYYAVYSVAELWAIWLGVYAIVRLGVWRFFHRHAVHRGIFHSVLAGFVFMPLTAIILTELLGRDPLIGWLGGVFVFMGYMVHLALDELYSVDFEGAYIKRSFGTALKFWEYDAPRASLLMTGALLVAITFAPTVTPFVKKMASLDLNAFLEQRMWPEDQWFAPPSASATETASRSGEEAPGR